MKYFSVLIAIFVLFSLATSEVSASLVVVNNMGDIEVNVLSESSDLLSEKKSINVKSVLNSKSDEDKIALSKSDDNLILTINKGNEKTNLDVSDLSDTVVEIEERQNVHKISIEVQDKNFVIKDGAAKVRSDFPITIDPDEGNIYIETSNGTSSLNYFPSEALQDLIRNKTITDYNNKEMVLEEGELGVLMYKITGEKVIDFFGFYEYPVEVNSYVSVNNGELVSIDQPPWLRVARIILQ